MASGAAIQPSVPPPSSTTSNHGLSTVLLPGSYAAGSSAAGLSCAAAIGAQGLLAYSPPQSLEVLVVCVNSAQLVQSLVGHKAPVGAILWHPPLISQAHHNQPRLCTGDEKGVVILWDVVGGHIERIVHIPRNPRVRSLVLSPNNQALIALLDDNSSCVFDAMLSEPKPVPGASLPTSDLQCQHSASRITTSALTGGSTAALALTDRVRIIRHVEAVLTTTQQQTQHSAAQSTAAAAAAAPQAGALPSMSVKDVVFQPESPATARRSASPLIVDVAFSRSVADLLFIAFREWVLCYDWVLHVTIKEQLVWCKHGVEFVAIFSVDSPFGGTRAALDGASVSAGRDEADDEEGDSALGDLPTIYSFTSDGRLSAWYVTSMDRFLTASCDVRGVRIPGQVPALARQADLVSTDFAVVFTDGSVALWRYLTSERCWSMHGFVEVAHVKPALLCGMRFDERIVGGSTTSPATMQYHRRSGDDGHDREHSTAQHQPVPPPSEAIHVAGLEYGDRHLRHDVVVTALDSGELAVSSAMYSTTLRRFTIVHTGTTRISAMVSYRDGLAWVATCRATLPTRNFHQVSLISVRSGVLRFVLRDPPAMHGEFHTLSSMQMDSTESFLLIGFSSGAFEVWNIDQRSLLHVNTGGGTGSHSSGSTSGGGGGGGGISSVVQHVAWGPQACSLDMSYGPYQLILATTRDASVQLYRVQVDRVVRLRETLPLRSSGGTGGGNNGGTGGGGGAGVAASLTCTIGDSVLMADGVGGGVAVFRGLGESSKWAPLQGLPRAAPVRMVGQEPATLRWGSVAAIVFEDGTVGTWDIRTLKRVGFSVGHLDPLVANTQHVQSVSWMGASSSHLAVLTEGGSILVVDVACGSPNSSFTTRSLRRPMMSAAFLRPHEMVHLKTLWEMSPLLSDKCSSGSGNEDEHPPTDLAKNLAQPLPSRSCLGHVIYPTLLTLRDEMALYARTMLPDVYARALEVAKSTHNVAMAACAVALYCGHRERAHFWALVSTWRSTWGSHADTALEFSKSGAFGKAQAADDDSGHRAGAAHHEVHDMFASQTERVVPFGPFIPAFLPDRYTDALIPEDALETNRRSLTNLRCYALKALQGLNLDDSQARVAVSRDLLFAGEHARAAEVLIDVNSDLDCFATQATAAVAIAAAASRSPQSVAYTVTAKRAAALLLAKGDVHGAAEKFALIGEYYEAALALQSKQLWHAAAIVARTSPMTRSCRFELLHRWASHCAQRGAVLAAARMLLALGSPRYALVLLTDAAPLTDLAGLFAVALASENSLLPVSCLTSRIASPFRAPSNEEPFDTLGETLTSLLKEYGQILETVGCHQAAEVVANVAQTLHQQA